MRVKLEDVCERGSSNLKQSDIIDATGDYPIYGASGYIGNVDFYHQDKPYVAVVKDGAGIGRTTLHPAKSSVIGTMQYLLPKENVLPEYLCYVVRYMHLEKYFTGATIPHIYFKDYKNEQFNLDSLERQAEIVDILGKCERVIASREDELQKLDELIKVRFVEMFGDPVRNPKGWNTYKLEDCLERIDNGKSFVCSDKARMGDYPAVLKLSAATYGDYRPDENKALLDEKMFVESAEVHKGDLLFTRKNTPELVGMAAYVDETPAKLMMPDLIFRLVPNEKMDAMFLWQLINCKEFRPVIQSVSGGSAKSMSNISKERLGKISVICPPRKLQEELMPFIHQIDKSKVA
ncbi:restriction endonuclease subunit S [Oribacterium sp. P6A1]|uniref:restriction endonuclease subunit S n=1 Tax=Oribacterium sp. P6A1 TaxID=1410612 RepID=UPI00055D393E|nr:restriction endonuclease subunit S [Oribacterium sp. P6A1]